MSQHPPHPAEPLSPLKPDAIDVSRPLKVLIFAASDPTSGAGLQADSQTVTALGAYPLTVLTAITAQDTSGVRRFEAMTAEWIELQCQTLLQDSSVDAVKIGVIGSVAVLRAIVAVLRQLRVQQPDLPIVFDPVMASGRGDALFAGGQRSQTALLKAMRDELIPLITVLTPNLPEAQRLAGIDAEGPLAHDHQHLAEAITALGCPTVLLSGGHDPVEQGLGATVVSRLFCRDLGETPEQDNPPVRMVLNTHQTRLDGEFHGSGCTLASATAALLARGMSLVEATEMALQFTWQCLNSALIIGQGQKIPDRWYWLRDLR